MNFNTKLVDTKILYTFILTKLLIYFFPKIIPLSDMLVLGYLLLNVDHSVNLKRTIFIQDC